MSSPARPTERRRRGLLVAAATVLAGLALWGPATAAERTGDGGTAAGGVAAGDPAHAPAHAPAAAGEPAGAVDRPSVRLLALVSTVCLAGAVVGAVQTLTVKQVYPAEKV
jgi:hypothetical protein